MSEHRSPIPARVYNAAVGGHVCGPEDIDFGQKVVHLIKYDKSGNEVSFESQITQANKIYVIHDDFVLSNNVNIPENCILKFDGGSINAGIGQNMNTITGNNTGIQTGLVEIFNTNITLAGTWSLENWKPEWFGVKNDVTFNSTAAFQKCIDSVPDGGTISLSEGKFLLDTLYLDRGTDSSINIIGAGNNTELIMRTAPLFTTRTTTSTIKRCNNSNIGNFKIIANNGGSIDNVSNVALKITGFRFSNFRNITFEANTLNPLYACVGIYGPCDYQINLDKIVIVKCKVAYGIKTLADNVYENPNIVNISNTTLYTNTDMESCIDMSCCTGYKIDTCEMEDSGKHAIILGNRGTVINCWAEAQHGGTPLVFQNNLGTVKSAYNTFIGNNFYMNVSDVTIVPSNCIENNFVSGIYGNIVSEGPKVYGVPTETNYTITPEMFGAIGDGTTDDTAAINKCLQYAPENSIIVFNAPKYVVRSTINIPHDYIKLCGKSTIFMSTNSDGSSNVIGGTFKNFITIEGLTIDVNGSARYIKDMTQPYRGISLTGNNIRIENVTVKNTLGAPDSPAVCISVIGNNNIVIACKCLDAGVAGKTSDGIYIGGENNIISNCFVLRCTDTAFVLENTSRSVITGCVSDSSGAVAAITCFAPYTYEGNIINGLTARNWNAINTGGISIGCVGSDSADCKLVNTSINNVVMKADTENSFGTGSAIYVRGKGNATVGDISISNCTIDGASKYGIEIEDTVTGHTLISNCNIKSNGGERCIATAGNSVFIQGCFLNGGIISVAVGSGVCNIRNNVIFGATGWAVWAYKGILNSIMNSLSVNKGIGTIGHDQTATVNHLDSIATGISSLNIDNNAPSGTPIKKYPVWDTNGITIIGWIPIYNQ